MQFLRKKGNEGINIYEDMADQKLFIMLRDDLLHSRTGIKLEEVLDKGDREKFRKEIKEYIRRIYRISDAKIQRFVTYIEQYIFQFHVLTEVMVQKIFPTLRYLPGTTCGSSSWEREKVRISGSGRLKISEDS